MLEHQLTRMNMFRDMLLVVIATAIMPHGHPVVRGILLVGLWTAFVAFYWTRYRRGWRNLNGRSGTSGGERPRDVAAPVSPSKVAVTHPRNRRAPQAAGRECPLARQGMAWRRGLRTDGWVARAPPGRVVVVRSMDVGCGVVMGGEERGGL